MESAVGRRLPRLLDRVRDALRVRHRSLRTIECEDLPRERSSVAVVIAKAAIVMATIRVQAAAVREGSHGHQERRRRRYRKRSQMGRHRC
jgi:hypothetical protein